MSLRNAILWGLRGLAVLLCLILVSCGLWWGLAALGDPGGSAGARGVAIVAIACFLLDVIGLVVLLAICQLQTDSAPHVESPPSEIPASSSPHAN